MAENAMQPDIPLIRMWVRWTYLGALLVASPVALVSLTHERPLIKFFGCFAFSLVVASSLLFVGFMVKLFDCYERDAPLNHEVDPGVLQDRFNSSGRFAFPVMVACIIGAYYFADAAISGSPLIGAGAYEFGYFDHSADGNE